MPSMLGFSVELVLDRVSGQARGHGRAPVSLSAAINARLTNQRALLAREGEFAGGVALLQSGDFAVLHDELPNVIRELRGPELETLDGN